MKLFSIWSVRSSCLNENRISSDKGKFWSQIVDRYLWLVFVALLLTCPSRLYLDRTQRTEREKRDRREREGLWVHQPPAHPQLCPLLRAFCQRVYHQKKPLLNGKSQKLFSLHCRSMYNALLTKCEVKMAGYNYWQVLLCISFMERDEGNNSKNKVKKNQRNTQSWPSLDQISLVNKGFIYD